MAIKRVGDDGDKSGGNTYQGLWKRRVPGEDGYVGSRAKKRMATNSQKPAFLRGAVRNITDYFGWNNVAATLNCTLTKVKELRLYNINAKDKTLITKLHILNAEYLRNRYAVPIPMVCINLEFSPTNHPWMKGGMLAIMRHHLNEGCFQGIEAYRDGSYLSPEKWRLSIRNRKMFLKNKKRNMASLVERIALKRASHCACNDSE